jgi:hypothetical protein
MVFTYPSLSVIGAENAIEDPGARASPSGLLTLTFAKTFSPAE